MSVVVKAMENQLKNIQSRTGKTLEELFAVYKASGLEKHGEVRELFIKEYGLGFGDATQLASYLIKSAGDLSGKVEVQDPDVAVAEIYSGGKAHLRPVHDEIMKLVSDFGPFEILPKKGYLSLRRKRQFAMIGPATNARIEVGINMKDIPPTKRLEQNPPGGMCQYKVKITSMDEVDEELKSWLLIAYNTAN